ncbi:MAG: O-antigen ligase family protein [Clostridia bacterium]|nr:O-antigen ligase family protein [Clostridia bacterium]
MMENGRKESRMFMVARAVPALIAALTGIFLLSVVPLYVHDGFFDINRAKVSLILTATPYFAAGMGLFLLLMPKKGAFYERFPWWLLCPMLLFLVGCVISCRMRGFEEAVLTGSEGRYGGLFFILSITVLFVIIALGKGKGTIVLALFLLSSSLIAVLGYVNALGEDPLGFYANMRPSQIPMFYATIGHYDFYGTFLLLPAAIAYGIVMRSEHLIVRLAAFCAAIVLTLGAYSARTDSVWMGMMMIAFSLIFLSGASYRHLARALLMIAFMIALFPISNYVLRNYSTHSLEFSGVYNYVTFRRGGEAAAVFAILAFLAVMFHSHDVKVPGFRKLCTIGLIVFLVALILFTCLAVYATTTTNDKALFGLAPTFRIDDNFGSRRGYIWIRSLRAFMAGSPAQMIFGQGLELTKRITRPFIESAQEEALAGGTYNDAHSQPIQILLTCGIFGVLMFLLHYLLLFHALLRYGAEDPVLIGIAVAMAGYFVIMAINVTQPILLIVYFGLSAVAVARIGFLRNKRG